MEDVLIIHDILMHRLLLLLPLLIIKFLIFLHLLLFLFLFSFHSYPHISLLIKKGVGKKENEQIRTYINKDK